MATIHDDQSQADVSIEELSGDYIQMVKSAQEVLARRRYGVLVFKISRHLVSIKRKSAHIFSVFQTAPARGYACQEPKPEGLGQRKGCQRES